MSHASIGDPVALGICIGFAMEPHERYGRLVAIRHGTIDREIERYVIREYAVGDGDFPTGGYRTTSRMFLTPHHLDGHGCRESRIAAMTDSMFRT